MALIQQAIMNSESSKGEHKQQQEVVASRDTQAPSISKTTPYSSSKTFSGVRLAQSHTQVRSFSPSFG